MAKKLGKNSGPLKGIGCLVVLVFQACFQTCECEEVFRGYPEHRGETKIGESTVSCGKRFFAGSSRTTPELMTAPIVGGRDAEPGEFPFIVSITQGFKDTHFCGGSLVGPQHVLTAAHCLQKQRFNLKVRVRQYDVNREQQVPGGPAAEAFGVQTYALHPDWNPTSLKNDLALITLDRPVTMDNFAQPICLPCCPSRSRGGVDFMVGTVLTTAGWGATREGGKMSPILQKVDVPVIDYASCKEKLSFYNLAITEKHLCGGYKAGGKDACQGDSGGPLFKEEDGFMTLEGVVSAGVGCARVDLPGVYTRVSEYVPWITQSMAAFHLSQEQQEAPAEATSTSSSDEQKPKVDEHRSEIEAFFGGLENSRKQEPNFISTILNTFLG